MAPSPRRHLLRNHTASSHAALDETVVALDSIDTYRRYLRGLHAFHVPAERLIAHRFHGRTKGARVVAAYDMASVMEAELEAVERGARRRPGGVAAAGAAFSAFVYMIERRFPHACFVGAADVQELLALHEASGMSGRVAVLACDAPRICVALDDPRDALIFRGWAAATLGAAA